MDASAHYQAFVINETSGAWGAAEAVPGTPSLNVGGYAEVNSLSCSSAGNCSAGGYYYDASDHDQAFVVNETSGMWGKAEEVPGTASLNAGGDARVYSLSCGSAGNCSAGGVYEDASGHYQDFVVNEKSGTWAKAEEAPGTAALNAGGDAEVDSLSCSSAGNCSAGGVYEDAADHDQAFVVQETSGTWAKAEEAPGTAALNAGGDAEVDSLSCSSAGNCSAGGVYEDAADHDQAFVVNETSGTWAKAEEVPGTAALNAGGDAEVDSLSCSSAGNCSAGGSYKDASDHDQAFVVNEKRGTWGKAEEVPGTAALNTGGDAWVGSLSCSSAGNCSAGGSYEDASAHDQAFVVNETSGAWGKAEEVPGTAGLNATGTAEINSVSCGSAGNCSAGGGYRDASGDYQAFVVNETSGAWAKAEELPGTGAALNAGGGASVDSLSCGSAGNCSAGGYYEDDSDHRQAFVANEVGNAWGEAEEVPGTALLNAGGSASVDSLSCSSAGNCSVGGDYEDASHNTQVFVANEKSGTWDNAEEVPGTAALNAGGGADVGALSCSSAGNCSVGGDYEDASHGHQAFVAKEKSGAWAKAEEVPGTGALNAGGDAEVYSISCRSDGNCSAGGYYEDVSGYQQAFVVNETGGTWGKAEEVPGTAALNAGGDAVAYSISCSSAGNCSAGGYYRDAASKTQAFVVNEKSGTWAKAEEVPGTAALNAGGEGTVNSLSCTSAGNCTAGGYYADASDHTQALVVNETGGVWGKAEEVPGTASLNAGGNADIFPLSCSSAGNCSAGGFYHDASNHNQAFVVNETGGVWGKAEEVPGIASLNAGGDAEVDSLSCSSAGNCSAGGSYEDASAHDQAFVATYFPRPMVAKLSPDKGPAAGGTIVTITGTGLLGATAVHFGTHVAGIDNVVSATEIKVTSPKGTGAIAVTVTTPGGTSARTKASRYGYFLLPRVTKLSPDHGPPSGGTTVTITGTNLLGPTTVHFGTRVARIDKVLSATEIKVISPKGSGVVAVTVATPGGTSAKTKADRYTY